MHYYQRRDRDIVDYQLVDVPGLPLPMRGPLFPGGSGRRSIAFIGAAQTFGTFVEQPFPSLVAPELGARWYNLGVGGAGPEAFGADSPYAQIIADVDLVVLQVMSGRSASNSRFTCRDGSNTLVDNQTGDVQQADAAYQRIIDSEGYDYACQLLDESKRNWAASMIELLDRIAQPTILFWFSQREEALQAPTDESVWGLFGEFPQAIDEATVAAVAGHASRYVRCVSSTGLPQTLRDRETGEPVSPDYGDDHSRHEPTKNSYYPSPEMHVEAAAALVGPCRDLLEELDDRPPADNHYAHRDRAIVDYRVESVRGLPHQVRGPGFPSGSGDQTIAFLGSAHTFGVFAPKPFPTLVGEALGTSWMNLGIGGAGPSVFGPNSAYIEQANTADLVVVQAMSGRSVSNSRFESPNGFSTLVDRRTGKKTNAYASYTQLLEATRDVAMIAGLVNESRWQWVQEMTDLFEAITVPTVLLWFAERQPDKPLVIDPDQSWKLMDGFPHFIDRPSIRAVTPFVDAVIEVVSSDGLPQTLVDADGQPATPAYPEGTGPSNKGVNSYYPSPTMHEHAAAALLPECVRLLAGDHQR